MQQLFDMARTNGQQAQQEVRATTQRMSAQEAIMFWCTSLCVIGGIVFWMSWWLGEIIRADGGILSSVMGFIFSLICALAIPVLLSGLIPSTPLGTYVAESKLRTPGMLFLGFAVGLLLWFSWNVFESFWRYHLAMPEGMPPELFENRIWWLRIVSMLLLQGLPAYAWVQVTPERMVLQIVQAHQVKKMRMQMQMEEERLRSDHDKLRMHYEQQLQIIKLSYVNALQRLRLPIAEQTAARFGEVGKILGAMHALEADTLNGLVVSVENLAGSEALVPQISTPELAANYDAIVQKLRELAERNDRSHYVASAGAPPALPAADPPEQIRSYLDHIQRSVRSDPDHPFEPPPLPSRPALPVAPVVAPAPVAAPAAGGSGPKTPELLSPAEADALAVAREHLDDPWTRKDIEKLFDKERSFANDLIRAWKRAGVCRELTEARFNYVWTEVPS